MRRSVPTAGMERWENLDLYIFEDRSGKNFH